MTRLIVATVLLAAAPALAWDSRGERDVEGKAAARMRWILQDKDEHRIIWLKTLQLAGAPADADADFNLHSFTNDANTLQPAPFTTAHAVQERIHSPSEFSQLPDFSYSLWDWALGNETCPLDPSIAPDDCHKFAGHMGATNSNHFLPQTSTAYNWYHQLAMNRAAACDVLRTRIGSRSDLQRFVKECVSEALVLEAIGHHFLQDSWAMGHMWQRWGSPNYADFQSSFGLTAFPVAMAVASLSGLIHGARALEQAQLPAGSDADDAMNAPWPDVTLRSPAGVFSGIGDLYLNDLLNGGTSTYAAQFNGLFSCAVGGVRAVLSAAGETLDAASLTPLDPSTHDLECFGQRATNQALLKGFAVDFITPGGTQVSIPLDLAAAGFYLVPGAVTIPQLDLIIIGAKLRVRAVLDPTGTDMADGGMGPLALVQPNASFNVLANYADPALPWPGAAASAAGNELVLAKQFHRAHAKDWCEKFKDNDPEFDIHKLIDHAVAATGSDRDAACEICAEFVTRHLRIGDPASYVPSATNEPLCGLIADDPAQVQYVFEPDNRGAIPRDLRAKSLCGCDPLGFAAGKFHNMAANVVGTSFLLRVRDQREAVPQAAETVTITGPAGWNGGQPMPLTYPPGFLKQFYTTTVPPVVGTYTATVGSASAQSDIGPSLAMNGPNTVTPDLATPGSIGSSWTDVGGATSYLTRVFDITKSIIRAPVSFTTATSSALAGLKLNGANQNALQVFAFSNDMRAPDPAVPPVFDVSFNRVILAPTVKVAPAGGSVAPAGTVSLSATVTGLSPTDVTWTAPGGSFSVASGPSTVWTAPNIPGTYPITATSNANPAFRAFSTIQVAGVIGCDPTQLAPLFIGGWTIAAWGPAFGVVVGSCFGGDFFPYLDNGGVFNISGSLGSTVGTFQPPPTFLSYMGNFSCGADGSFRFASNANEFEFFIRLGAPEDPTNTNVVSGTIAFELAQQGRFHVVGCMADFEAVR